MGPMCRGTPEVPLTEQTCVKKPALGLVIVVASALALAGCANLKLQNDDRLPTRIAKLTTRGLLWPLTFGSSEAYVTSAGGEREWEATFRSIDESISQAARQSRDGRTLAERERGRLAHERFSEIRASLETEYARWRAKTDQAFKVWTWSHPRSRRATKARELARASSASTPPGETE